MHGVLLQVATAIRGAIILAKMSVVPVRRGYWGNKIGKPHTVPTKARPARIYAAAAQLCKCRPGLAVSAGTTAWARCQASHGLVP